MYHPFHAIQAIRYFAASLKQKREGPTRYKGNAEQICKQIVKACWNGQYFQTSTCHYKEFWARDFGYTADSLIKLGYKKEVLQTLVYAIEKYSNADKITTTISREGTPFSFPNIYSPDSVALFIHTLRHAPELVKHQRQFLQEEITKFANKVLDDAGRVKRNVHYSEMRDYARHDSSCYNQCMAVLIAQNARKMGFEFAYTEKELIKALDEYWVGTHYRDDRKIWEASGDANTFPYWIGKGKNFKLSLKAMQANTLDVPFPLAYSSKQHAHMINAEIFVPGWQNDTIWPILGLTFMQVVKNYNRKLAMMYKKEYAKIIEKYGTLYEVYHLDKEPYKSFFYHADEGMIWAANFLTI